MTNHARVLAIAMTALASLLAGCTSTASQRTYASPDEAAQSLVRALRAPDRDELKHILGPGCEEVLSSGDEVSDRNAREAFLEKYDVRHTFVPTSEASTVLVVGDSDWPMPIPIVKDTQKNAWYFDTEAGKDEVTATVNGSAQMTR